MMQDSDDYFDDDLVLDESTLAVLDQEEQKFNAYQRLTPQAQPGSQLPPPAKRQKLFHGEISRAESHSAFEDLPDVSVYGNGAYDLSALASGPVPGHSWGQAPQSTTKVSEWQDRTQSTRLHPSPLDQQPAPQRRPLNSRNPTTSRHSTIVADAPLALSARSVSGPSIVEQRLQAELELLRSQVQQLSQAQEEARKILDAERELVSSKAGEVTILRRNAEQSAREHAAEVARIKAAKEAAEAAQAQIKKEMKEEMERLKTQFTFKQYEMETGSRKPPLSTKSKDAYIPSTPVPMAPQVRPWEFQDTGAGPSNEPQTPSRRGGAQSKGSPSRPRNTLMPRDSPKKPAMLPGFTDGFAAPQHRRVQHGKGKNPMRDVQDVDPLAQEALASSSPAHSPPPSNPLLDPQPQENMAVFNANDAADSFAGPEEYSQPPIANEDVEMADAGADRSPDDHESFTPQDRNTEVSEATANLITVTMCHSQIQGIIFTHRLPHTETLTLHLLLSTSLPDSASTGQRQGYACLCDEILERLSSILSTVEGADYFDDRLSDTFVKMARILTDVQAMQPLAALLALLRALVLRLHTFPSTLLSHVEPGEIVDEAPSSIVAVCCDIIRTCLAPRKEPFGEMPSCLAKQTLQFLHTLTWHTPSDIATKLALIPSAPGVLTALLALPQPTWFLHLSTKLLVYLACHYDLVRPLLSNSGSSTVQGDVKKIPQIEQVSFFLVDPSREGPEADALRECVLRFVASLEVAHPDAHTLLLDHPTLIPSIVFYLHTIATPVYEEDPELLGNAEALTKVCSSIQRTVYLLHKLCVGAPLNMRYKLSSPYRHFHGVPHMFVVTLGRLTYAEGPSDLNDAQRAALKDVTDMSRELLELVFDDPDIELIYSAYDVDEDMEDANRREENDEEREAQLLLSDDMQ